MRPAALLSLSLALLSAFVLAGCGRTSPVDGPPTSTPDTARADTGITVATAPAPATLAPPTPGSLAPGADPPVTPPAGTPDPPPDRFPRPPADVAPFEDRDALANGLVTAEKALADASTPAGEMAGWARVHQQAYRDLVTHPGWQGAVRNRVPDNLREAFDLNVLAVTHLRQLTALQPDLPAWRIVAPPPVDELRGYYDEVEAELGVPWNVLAAIHLVETRFGRIQGDSPAGAQGPMQFLPATWEAYGEGDIDDPRDAILAAGRYLVAHGAPGDLPGALHAYNHSDHYVAAILAHAEAMDRYDHYLDVYHGWRVYYRTVDGDVVLEEGYGS